MVRHTETFANDKEAYGEDQEYPARKPAKKHVPLMTHDVPFKPANPSKKGYNKTLNKFPEYKPDPMKVAMRKKEVEGGSDMKEWRTTHKRKTAPC